MNNIPRVGHFEKVTYFQFEHDIKESFGDKWTDEEIKKFYDKIQIPKRATRGSSGYDIRTPIPFELRDWEDIRVPTGLRIIINEPGWWLMCMPRSGHGFKHYLRLSNTVGNIDSDYSGAKNEGHIWAKVRVERGVWYKVLELFKHFAFLIGFNVGDSAVFEASAGDAIVQGVLVPFGITDDDDADGVRDGGFGSTGR